MSHHEMFPESHIALNREARKHPPLMEILDESQLDPTDFMAHVSVIATYCEVIIHGAYAPFEIDTLCGVLTRKLQDKRKVIILTH